ncbi:MAG: hypothetical protein ACLR8Y_09015 [Alistipes indistinctus]
MNVVPEVERIPGVGRCDGDECRLTRCVSGSKPDVMAEYKLMPSDVLAALAEQNIDAAPGQFGELGDQSFQYVMR